MDSSSRSVHLLREWRGQRRLSQLELASVADISTEHLSFVETGRAAPSRHLVFLLADRLDVPLRAQQAAARCRFRPGVPGVVRSDLRRQLDAYDPYPAAVVDRNWNLIDTNASASLLTEGIRADLLEPTGERHAGRTAPGRPGRSDDQPR